MTERRRPTASPRSPERCGEAPVAIGEFDGRTFTELLHWLYSPIHRPEEPGVIYLPPNLRAQGIGALVELALSDAKDWQENYVYVTARRGFATPDNPLNRVGWHTDGFGTDDVNYIWSDRYPTQWLDAPEGIGDPTEDHVKSVAYFEARAQRPGAHLREVRPFTVYRLSPYVVHCTPNVPAPGAMRSWVKVSLSRHRYNLIGNSHNWEMSYDWTIVERDALRNDPARAMHDFAKYREPEEPTLATVPRNEG